MSQDGLAVTVYREAGEWRCDPLPPAVLDDLETCVAALRQLPAEGDVFGLVNVEDEFFVAVRTRPGGGHVRVLLSDAMAALDWDLAQQAMDELGEEIPAEEDAEDVWPVGDLRMFADFGLPAEDLRLILDDLDLYADEMLAAVAQRAGFWPAYSRVVEELRR